MKIVMTAVGITAVLGLAACSEPQDNTKLRAALDKAQLSLSDSVAVAENDTAGNVGFRARLVVDESPVFSVGVTGPAPQDVEVDSVSGQVLSKASANTAASLCPGAISLGQTLAAAEAEVSGEAVAAEPDDDGECNMEVKVLAGDTLWEVKVGPDGSIVDSEEDDEGGSGD